MGKIAIVVAVIIAVCTFSVIFAVPHSSSKTVTTPEGNHIIAGSQGRHLTLELTEDVNIRSAP